MARSRFDIDERAVARAIQEEILLKRNKKMVVEESPTPLTLRLFGAILGSIGLGYLLFVMLDLAFGWGIWFYVLRWAVFGVLSVGLFALICNLWVWVYRGTGRYQMRNGKR